MCRDGSGPRLFMPSGVTGHATAFAYFAWRMQLARQPDHVADFAEPPFEPRPGLAAIGAAIELAQTRRGEHELRVGRMGRDRPHRAVDWAGQGHRLPMLAVVAAA